MPVSIVFKVGTERRGSVSETAYRDTIKFYDVKGEHGFLSNFYMHPLTADGLNYPSAEHYYQSLKFPDCPEYREEIRHANTAGIARNLGMQSVKQNYAWAKKVRATIGEYKKCAIVRPDWDSVKVREMRKVLQAKFSDKVMLEKLQDTRGSKLEEDSKRDEFWGTGKRGDGANMLGLLLMELRDSVEK